MKRLLLSCALIGATFACNAMTQEEKYNEIINLENARELTVKHVNENLVNNEYVNAHQDEFLKCTITIDNKLETENLVLFIAHAKKVSEMGNQVLFDTQRPIANDYLGRIRIIELGSEINDDDFLDRDPSLQKLKAEIEEIFKPADEEDNTDVVSSVTSAVFSKRGGIALVAIVAAYFGYSYWNNSKKAQQSN